MTHVPAGGSDPTGGTDLELDPTRLAERVRRVDALDPHDSVATSDPIADDVRRTHPDLGRPEVADDELDPATLAARVPRGH